MKGRRLTTNLPEDVWDRLAAEAADNGVTIGKYLSDLVVKRDKKKYPDARP